MTRYRNSALKLFIMVTGMVLFAGCGAKNETAVNLKINAAGVGQFFAGPNSLMAEYPVDLSSIKGLEEVSKDQLKEIKINRITVLLDEIDGFKFDSFTSATLQLVGTNTGMQTIAIKNPINSNNLELVLEVSAEVDLVEYFKGDNFSLLLDLDFIEDSFAEKLSSTIDLELTVKHN